MSEWTGSGSDEPGAQSAYFVAALNLLEGLSKTDLEDATQYLEALRQRRRDEDAES